MSATLETRAPSGLGRGLSRFGLTLALSVGAVTYSILRESTGPLDPYALLTRFIGFAAGLRALVSLRDLGPLMKLTMTHSRYSLRLDDNTLTLTQGEAVQRLDLASIASVVQTPRDGVWLLLRADPMPRALALPPIFDTDEGALVERLMRAAPVSDASKGPDTPPPIGLPSLRYDEAAAGKPPDGALVLPHGLGWLVRGPYAAPLFALTLASGLAAEPGSLVIGPIFTALLAVCVAVPSLWLMSVRRAMKPRKGLALLLTPEEVLLRTRSGVLRAPYDSLISVGVERSVAWTLLRGSLPQEKLVLERESDLPIRYDAGFFSWPVEVVVEAIEAYRKGRLP